MTEKASTALRHYDRDIHVQRAVSTFFGVQPGEDPAAITEIEGTTHSSNLELFHFTSLSQQPRQLALINPESYAYFAMALWYLGEGLCDFSTLTAQQIA